jgi:ribose 1,5-bisphosphokinase PhnN
MLSLSVAARLAQAAAKQDAYMPNATIAHELDAENLVMFVGPAAVGKSFLMNRLAEQDIDFGRVAVFTSRDARPDDESGMFRYIPHDDAHISQLLDKIDAGDVVQYAVHPTSGRMYGSEITDYTKPFNMLATLSDIVNPLRRLPFQTTRVIGLAVDPDVWLRRFYDRYVEPSEEQRKRLNEAVGSLQWLLDPANVHEITWVDNTSSDETAAVQSVIDTVKRNKPSDTATLRIAQTMLQRLRKELVR